MKHLIGQTRNGVDVYVQLIGSAAGEHISRQPRLLTLAKEMFANVTLRGAEINIEYDTDRPIGYDFIVETSDSDTVFYGCLLRDKVYTRFVKNAKPLPTRYLTAMLAKGSDDTYELSDIWIGRMRPPLPGSTTETIDSKSYWANHALILDNQPLQQRTLTKVCPY